MVHATFHGQYYRACASANKPTSFTKDLSTIEQRREAYSEQQFGEYSRLYSRLRMTAISSPLLSSPLLYSPLLYSMTSLRCNHSHTDTRTHTHIHTHKYITHTHTHTHTHAQHTTHTHTHTHTNTHTHTLVHARGSGPFVQKTENSSMCVDQRIAACVCVFVEQQRVCRTENSSVLCTTTCINLKMQALLLYQNVYVRAEYQRVCVRADGWGTTARREIMKYLLTKRKVCNIVVTCMF
jgi:hypothetical protein